jgi:hypothetical protein
LSRGQRFRRVRVLGDVVRDLRREGFRLLVFRIPVDLVPRLVPLYPAEGLFGQALQQEVELAVGIRRRRTGRGRGFPLQRPVFAAGRQDGAETNTRLLSLASIATDSPVGRAAPHRPLPERILPHRPFPEAALARESQGFRPRVRFRARLLVDLAVQGVVLRRRGRVRFGRSFAAPARTRLYRLRSVLLRLAGLLQLLSLSQHVTLPPSVPLTGPPLQLDAPPRLVVVRALVLRPARIPEPRAHPEEVLSGGGSLDRGSQPEEGVVLDGALPQVLARFLVVQTEDERVLLFAALVVVLDDDQGEFLLLEVELSDFGPEEQTDLLDALEDQDSGGGQAQSVLHAVFAEDGVHVHAVHFQPFRLVQVAEFGLGGRQAAELLEFLQDLDLQLFRLVRDEAELGDGGGGVLGLVVVAQLG